MLILFLLIISFIQIINNSLKCYNVTGASTRINGYTNQSIQLKQPFQRQFWFEIVPPQDRKYISFSSNSLTLKKISTQSINPKNRSLLQQLRSPDTNVFRNMLVIKNIVFVLRGARNIDIIQEVDNKFTKLINASIQQIDQKEQFSKAYRYRQNAIVFAGNNAYSINKYGNYFRYNFTGNSVAHAQWISDTQYMFVAQYQKGLGIYKVSGNMLIEIGRYNEQFFKKQRVSIEDVNLGNPKSNKIFILDRHFGIYELQYSPNNISNIQFKKEVLHHSDCYSMDLVSTDYFVLVCMMETRNYIIEVIIENNVSNIISPIFKNQFIVDVQVSPSYFLTYSEKTIHVHWNSKNLNFPSEFREGNDLTIPAMQTMSLVYINNRHYLYAITNNDLQKFELIQVPAKISYRSNVPSAKAFQLQIYGQCENPNRNIIIVNIPDQYTMCSYKSEYLIYVAQVEQFSQSHINLLISLAILSLTILVLIGILCFRKYKNLEKSAKKILQQYISSEQKKI